MAIDFGVIKHLPDLTDCEDFMVKPVEVAKFRPINDPYGNFPLYYVAGIKRRYNQMQGCEELDLIASPFLTNDGFISSFPSNINNYSDYKTLGKL